MLRAVCPYFLLGSSSLPEPSPAPHSYWNQSCYIHVCEICARCAHMAIGNCGFWW